MAEFILSTAYLTVFQLGNAINDAATATLWPENAMESGETMEVVADYAEKTARHTAGTEKKA